ncbi:MAG: glycosyltransferase [Candidatus Dojkabacteria bacterium]|nr:glycosyltransferase [Candidatus Dojkabacteria bacterium]
MKSIKVLNKKILFIGGHLTPALAVLHEIRKRGYRKIFWVGTKQTQLGDKNLSAEFQIVNSLGIKFFTLKTGKLIRKWSKNTIKSGIIYLLLIPIGIINSFLIVLKVRPKVIVSFGGYLSVFIVLFGKLLGSKIITYEQTLVPGLANKIGFLVSNKILLGWKETKIHKRFSTKIVITGNPIRKEVFLSKSNVLTSNFDTRKPTLFITCGNQGSNIINQKIFDIIDIILDFANVIHQTGSSSITKDYQKALEIQNKLPYLKKIRYTVKDYINQQEIGEAFNKSDIILCRAGANTVTEILALGKLAILIPIPWTSGNEQLLNAKIVESTGLGLIIQQDDNFTASKLIDKIRFAIEHHKLNRGFNGTSLSKCQEHAKSFVNFSAAEEIANVIENILLN